MTALEYGSYGKPEDWEGLRKVKAKEVGFAEMVFEGKVASRVPILQCVRTRFRLSFPIISLTPPHREAD